MFEVVKPVENCLLFLFNKQKDLALTFFRVQEYYESNNDKLKGTRFDIFDFLVESMNEHGGIDYFWYWEGFNIPGIIVNCWFTQNTPDVTPLERNLFQEIKKNVDVSKSYYVIGALKKDKNTIKHEIAHALFYLNPEYEREMMQVTEYFHENFNREHGKLAKQLKKIGYGDNVIWDEFQAYLSTGTKSELVEELNLDVEKLAPVIRKYRKVLSKYNTYK
jgi:hypothetical protein